MDPKIQWIKANVNQSGYYRVNYDQRLWDAIITQLMSKHTAFSPADRASLLDDAFTLSRCVYAGTMTNRCQELFLQIN